MRLVDADNCNLVYALSTYSHYTGIDEAPYEFANQELVNAPTIKAIPIEWLKQWERNYNKKLPIEFRGETIIKEILEDWEKEK